MEGDLCDPLEIGVKGVGGLGRWSAAELGMRLEDWIWRGGGKGKNLQFIFVSKYILEADSIFRKVKN